MTTLMIPSIERRLLQTVREEVAAEPVSKWPARSLQLCVNFLRGLRESAAEMRRALEEELAEGVEARSFARVYSPYLPVATEQLAFVRELLEGLPPARDTASETLFAELRLLAQENEAFRDLLATTLSRASEAPRPVNWERVRAAEQAQVSGKTRPFSRK